MIRWTLLLLFFFFASGAWAARSTEWALHIDTKAEYRHFDADLGADVDTQNSRLELQPSYKWTYKDSFRLYLKPDYVADLSTTSEMEKNYFDFSEAYLRYQTGSVTLQAGNTLYAWGVTDGYNPLDVVNARQYFDPLQSHKKGATALTFSQSFSSWDYDLIYIPRNQDATLPGEQSRWLPREIFVPETPDNDLVLILPTTLRYHYRSRETLDEALDHNAAFRFQWRGFVDLGLYYYDGVASFPLVKPAVTGNIVEVSPKTMIAVDPDISLRTQNYRLRHGGISLVRTQWETLFKAVATYSQSLGDDLYLPGWNQENIVAVERNFNLGAEGMLIAVLQKSFIFSEKENDSNLSTTEIFRDAWMLGGRFSWGDNWTGSVSALWEARFQSHYEELSLSRRLWDAWILSAAARVISGDASHPLGIYHKNDSYSLSLSRSF